MFSILWTKSDVPSICLVLWHLLCLRIIYDTSKSLTKILRSLCSFAIYLRIKKCVVSIHMHIYSYICNCIYVSVCECAYSRNYAQIYCWCCHTVLKLVKVSSRVLNGTLFGRYCPMKIESFKTLLMIFSTFFLNYQNLFLKLWLNPSTISNSWTLIEAPAVGSFVECVF